MIISGRTINNETDYVRKIDGKYFIEKLEEYYDIDNDNIELGKKLKESFLKEETLNDVIEFCGYQEYRNDFYYLVIIMLSEMFNKSFQRKFKKRMKREGITLKNI